MSAMTLHRRRRKGQLVCELHCSKGASEWRVRGKELLRFAREVIVTNDR